MQRYIVRMTITHPTERTVLEKSCSLPFVPRKGDTIQFEHVVGEVASVLLIDGQDDIVVKLEFNNSHYNKSTEAVKKHIATRLPGWRKV